MKVFIKNKLMSIEGSSKVTNEQGEDVFKVEGKLISPTKKKRMYDMQGNLLYTIRNKYWTFFCNKVLIYDKDNNKVAVIKKNKFSFNAKYQILEAVDDMSIEGRIFRRDAKIMRNGEVAATLRSEFTLFKDAFSLEASEEDIAFMTAIVIGFDNMKDKIQDSRD